MSTCIRKVFKYKAGELIIGAIFQRGQFQQQQKSDVLLSCSIFITCHNYYLKINNHSYYCSYEKY